MAENGRKKLKNLKESTVERKTAYLEAIKTKF